MAQFLPFCGLRYNCTKVNLPAVLCPPYDVIKGHARDQLLARDAHNIVAIELAARYGETASSEQYARCATLLQQWQSEGILVRDDSSFYLYEQEFPIPGSAQIAKRRGVMGALTLEEFGKGVQPHEHTLSGPKADRLNLLRALKTNTSPIFGLVADDDGWISGLLDSVAFNPPACEATDAEGTTHRLWQIADDETINGLEAAFENESILIADGHHRYETALNFRREEAEESENWTGGEGANGVMMLCVSMADPGLVVLPTHRLVKNVDPAQVAALPENLAKYFEVEPLEGGASAFNAALGGEDGPAKIGLHLAGQSYLLKLRPDDAQNAMDAAKSAAYNALDVSALHRLILENELGIDADKLAAGGHVSYTIHVNEAMEKVEKGEAQAAFLLRSTPARQVAEVANAGDKMPQKSTYFYPKLMTGLVLRPLD